jgi:catechol 2,3-dioxygenase-like lactoylglutathione lyase family enzyme
MFKDTPAFSGFSATNLDEIETFYKDVLGLDVERQAPPMDFVTLKLATGGRVLVYPKENHEPATYTVLNFPVKDVGKAVDELIAKGVTFEKYDGMEQDEKGIAWGSKTNQGPDIAWFTDPAGNILSVLSEDPEAQ